jgi:hypothetical protein
LVAGLGMFDEEAEIGDREKRARASGSTVICGRANSTVPPPATPLISS